MLIWQQYFSKTQDDCGIFVKVIAAAHFSTLLRKRKQLAVSEQNLRSHSFIHSCDMLVLYLICSLAYYFPVITLC